MRGSGGGIAFPLAVTFAIQTIVALAVYCAPVMAPVAAQSLGFPASAIGYFITAVFFGSMLGTVTAGGSVARLGPIRVSQIGLALSCAGLACAATGILPLVLLGAVLIGLGYGPSTPASSVILAKAAPPSMVAFTFSIKQTGVPAGAAIAGVVVPALIPLVGWQGATLFVAGLCLALAFAIAPGRRLYDGGRDPHATLSLVSVVMPIGMVLRAPRLREIAIAGFVFGGLQITLLTYLVTFMIEGFAMTLVLAGLVLSVSQVASVVGRIGWGVVADRLLTRRTMLGLLGAGMGLSCFATLFAGPEWPRWLVFAFAAVFGATAVGWNGVWVAEVVRLAPEGKVSEATGGSLFFTFLGVVITPPLFNAALAATGSYALAYAVCGVPALVMGLRLLLWRTPEK